MRGLRRILLGRGKKVYARNGRAANASGNLRITQPEVIFGNSLEKGRGPVRFRLQARAKQQGRTGGSIALLDLVLSDFWTGGRFARSESHVNFVVADKVWGNPPLT
jgi:hypothetical protein